MLMFFLLLLQSTWSMSSAQPPSESGGVSSSATPATDVGRGFSIFLLVIAGAFFFTGIVFVSFRRHLGARFFGVGVDGGGLGAGRSRGVAEGLSQEAIESFPTYFYEDVKVHRRVDAELECAICLSQFQDHEVLRLLPECNHVFHPQCIDPWLHSQATCPVCRKVLEPSTSTLTAMNTEADASEDNRHVIIMDPIPPVKSPVHQASNHGGPCEPESTTTDQIDEPQIVLDRYTLMLPEEARCKLESTAWRFAKPSSGGRNNRSKTPESGRIELNGLGCESDGFSLSGTNRNWKSFVSQPASPLSDSGDTFG